MSRTARFRRLASAACLVLGPALLLAATIVLPWYGDANTAETLRITGENVTATQLGDLLAFCAVLAMIPAVLAVMRLLRSCAAVLGLVGGALAVAGWASAMLWVVSDQLNIGAAEATGLRDQFAAAMDDSSAWVIWIVLAVFLVGIIVGGVLLGAGLLRARIVPAWAGAAVVLSSVMPVVAHAADLQALDVIGSVLLVAGFAAVARLVLSVSDADWDLGEISPPAQRTEGAGRLSEGRAG